MGSGKTTIGKEVALNTDLSFIDLDEEIMKKEKLSIVEIFTQQGEKGFRLMEQKMLHHFLENDNFVMACGGGTPCFFDNLQKMNAYGITIYLQTPEEILFHRLKSEKGNRPLLKNLTEEKLPEFIRLNIQNREKSYKMAKFTLGSDQQVNLITKEIIDLIKI